MRKLANQLLTAKKFGEMFKSVDACETTFKCPLSGFEYQEIINNNGLMQNHIA